MSVSKRGFALKASAVALLASMASACNKSNWNFGDYGDYVVGYDLCLFEKCSNNAQCNSGYCIGTDEIGACMLPIWALVLIGIGFLLLCIGCIACCICCCRRRRVKHQLIETHHHYEIDHRRITGEVATTVTYPNQPVHNLNETGTSVSYQQPAAASQQYTYVPPGNKMA